MVCAFSFFAKELYKIMGNLEDELWDDAGKETKPIKHTPRGGVCGGRVFWISGEEHRCIKCGKKVEAEDMEFKEVDLAVV
jgi:hypothetical protein